jgi:hypothetical protein
VLKRDRTVLQEMVESFNTSTRQAEQGIERLRATSEGAGRHIARQLEEARAVKDDLTFLLDRGERTADRLDALVRGARPMMNDARAAIPHPSHAAPPEPPHVAAPETEPMEPRVRSQAERDLLRALRMARS